MDGADVRVSDCGVRTSLTLESLAADGVGRR